jgi:hypothetical protein
MRLARTSSIAAAAVLAISGSALAAATHKHSRTVSTKATSSLHSGTLTVTTTHKSNAKRFGVRMDFDVMVKSKTVLAFFAYPCQSNKCLHYSTSTITLAPGHRIVKFTGNVPIVTRQKGGKTVACVFAQLRDRGPNGKKPGKIVHKTDGSKGVTLCTTP